MLVRFLLSMLFAGACISPVLFAGPTEFELQEFAKDPCPADIEERCHQQLRCIEEPLRDFWIERTNAYQCETQLENKGFGVLSVRRKAIVLTTPELPNLVLKIPGGGDYSSKTWGRVLQARKIAAWAKDNNLPIITPRKWAVKMPFSGKIPEDGYMVIAQKVSGKRLTLTNAHLSTITRLVCEMGYLDPKDENIIWSDDQQAFIVLDTEYHKDFYLREVLRCATYFLWQSFKIHPERSKLIAHKSDIKIVRAVKANVKTTSDLTENEIDRRDTKNAACVYMSAQEYEALSYSTKTRLVTAMLDGRTITKEEWEQIKKDKAFVNMPSSPILLPMLEMQQDLPDA